MNRRALLTGAAVFLCAPGATAQTATGPLSAREAREAFASGKIVLVDIRTPAEWADTGVPRGAIRLDAGGAGFELRLAGIRLDNPGRRLALIDRTGGLATAVQQKLGQRGWRDLLSVRGGMLGPGGWLAEKLPVEP
jgi:rhodanese-related sulfurtransferase